MNTKKITVILVDDHAIVRAGFRLLLATEETIEVIAEAERGEQVLQLYGELQPDVVIMDLSMVGIGGLEATRRLVLRYEDAKIIVFSVHHEKVYVQRALNAGARGYICKHAHPEVLITAIKKVFNGEIYVEPNLIDDEGNTENSTDYQAIIDSFSPREFDVFLMLAEGLTPHKIAEQLCLSYKTIANYGTNIRSKLNVSSMAELAHIALLLNLMK
ncbi:MAG: response regulator transcription factor [Methylococcales bacterium]|nr:response regulator transcription factor [Methylococcales bacterium]MDD5754691.1 response regulator transcription factor [Methylococcales bacterium]